MLEACWQRDVRHAATEGVMSRSGDLIWGLPLWGIETGAFYINLHCSRILSRSFQWVKCWFLLLNFLHDLSNFSARSWCPGHSLQS